MEASLRFYTEVLGHGAHPQPGLRRSASSGCASATSSCTSSCATRRRPSSTTSASTSTTSRPPTAMAKERGAARRRRPGRPTVRELNDGSVQMYLRDPAGNLVEIDWPDVDDAGPLGRRPTSAGSSDERPQSEARAQRAALLRRLRAGARPSRPSRSRPPRYACNPPQGRCYVSRPQCRCERSPGSGPRPLRRPRSARGSLIVVFPVVWVLFIANGHDLRLGGQRPEGLPHHAAERAHRGGAVLRGRQRLHAHLRADARREHGPRRLLPASAATSR